MADSYFPKGMPLPQGTVDDQEYWAWTRRHRLMIQRCTKCGTFRHNPIPFCYNCRALEYVWVDQIPPIGVVYSFTIVRAPAHPALVGRPPFNIVLVELPRAGGVRLASNLVDLRGGDGKEPVSQVARWNSPAKVPAFEPDPKSIYVGMPVEVVWEDHEDVTLPLFMPSADPEAVAAAERHPKAAPPKTGRTG
ncbi:MAG: OB-fold domain-containing protein [Chloroflexi bacterium]|nr:OB-fold domain-containing protein [Chloroflexota bacterium]